MSSFALPAAGSTVFRDDLSAIFVSLELSLSSWLVTSLSPDNGEKCLGARRPPAMSPLFWHHLSDHDHHQGRRTCLPKRPIGRITRRSKTRFLPLVPGVTCQGFGLMVPRRRHHESS